VDKLPISATIIGLNEEANLNRCMESIADFVQEIIFVDSFSTDQTLKIANKYTEKVFEHKFTGYTEQKNYADSLAKNDWILNIDCDEVVPENLKEEIMVAFNQKAENISSFSMPRLTFYCYRWIRHSGWYPDRKIRLYNRQKASWQGNLVHEQLVVNSGQTFKLKSDLLHYSFPDISTHLKTLDNFSTKGAQDAYDRGKRSGPFTIIFRSLWIGFRKVVFERSFLDGTAGLILTGLSMAATWSKYSKLYILHKREKLKQQGSNKGE
jgi:glycosyltransferase involved in cell wall biosynthesis